MPSDEINVNATFRNSEILVQPVEHADDRALRLKTEHRRQMIADWQDVAVFATLLIVIIAAGVCAAYEGIFDPEATPDTRRWAQTVLSAIVTGGISFVIGRNSRK